MSVEEAKKILSGNFSVVSLEILKRAVKIILSELGKAEEKIFELEKNSANDLPEEIWKDIEGYEGKYQISNMGRVKSFCGKNPRILILSVNSWGYYTIGLRKNGKHHRNLLHVLIAKAFIPNPENKPFVNHKDGNKKNNSLDNLEWVTRSENMKHAFKIGLCKIRSGVQNSRSKFTEEQVKFIRENYKPRDPEFGIIAMAKKFNVGKNTIYNIVSRESYKDIK